MNVTVLEWITGALKTLSWCATFAIMFSGALRLKPETLRGAGTDPRLFVRTLIVIWIGVPAFTGLVIFLLGVTGKSAALLLLMSVCPGVPLILGTTRAIKGAMATAFLALVLTAATEPLMIPFWARQMSNFLPMELRVKPKDILDVLLPMVFLPIAIGFVIRDVSDRLTVFLTRLSDLVYVVGVTACLIAIIIKGLPLLPQVPMRAVAAAFIITLGDIALGFWAGRPIVENQKAIALAATLGNPALAIAVVDTSYPEVDSSTLVSIYLLVRGIAMIPVEWWLKRIKET